MLYSTLNRRPWYTTVSLSISRGLLWLWGSLSWLQISSLTHSMFCCVLADLGQSLPGLRSVVLLLSILLITRLTLAMLQALFGNSFLLAPHCFSNHKCLIRILSSVVIFVIVGKKNKKTDVNDWQIKNQRWRPEIVEIKTL